MIFFRIQLEMLFTGKLHFRENESDFVWRKLFLPLSTTLGLRGRKYWTGGFTCTALLLY